MAITIREVEPVKLSGRSSLLVSFPYNPALVEVIKKYTPAIFHKKLVAWEIQSTYLSEILDELTYYDSIELILRENEIREISSEPLSETEIISFKQKPYKHQIEAINYGLSKDKWLLLDSMGLGKTFESMCLAETLHRRGLIEHCLVICGVDSLRQNWKNEIKKFSNESVIVLGEKINKNGKVSYETLTKRAAQLISPISEFFVVVNITNIRDDKFIEAFKKSTNKFDMIIFDECHRATKRSQQGSNLLELDAKYKIAMSGSLIVNSPISAYLPLSWTDNDHATLTNFKSQYCNFGGFHDSQVIGYKNLELLKDELANCSLRRTFDQVRGDMPVKTIEYELVEMSDSHQKFYDAIKAGVKEEADKIELNTSNLLSLMTRLRQATAAPGILTTEDIESSKLERAAELAEDLLEAGEKVIIMSNFKEPVYRLATKLERFRPLLGTGDQNEDVVSRNINDFRNLNNFNLLIGTHGKIGTGFSMPECHYMIMVDTPYTYAQFSQSVDRIYRITSDQPVYVKVLCCKDTVDERVKEIVDTKRDLSDFVIDNKETALTKSLRSIILDL